MSDAPKELPSPGWDAINHALGPVYRNVEPFHYAAVLPYSLGGQDPLRGISAYRRDNPPHWHFVTYGLTELYEKESEDLETSGYGFELTLRVARTSSEQKPPAWALNFLNNLARYVFGTGNAFDVGHHMPLNGPIVQGSNTVIWAALFGRDPELGDFTSSNGRASFIQIFGATMDELNLVMEWNAEAFLEEVRAFNPLLITDVKRQSMLSDSTIQQRLRDRAGKEGSSMSFSFMTQLRVMSEQPTILQLGALAVEPLLRAIRGRILHSREFLGIGQELKLQLVSANDPGISFRDGVFKIAVSPALAEEILRTLKTQRGDYRWPSLPTFTLRVVPTQIKDNEGNVAQVVG